MNKKLRRSRTDRRIAGVCGGLAQFLDIDSTAVRVAMALLILFGGMSLIAYLVMWLIIPDEY
jgi:phage shock protein PspC (stress-responsive transcriptional regulator)